jgi:hypothetical protein
MPWKRHRYGERGRMVTKDGLKVAAVVMGFALWIGSYAWAYMDAMGYMGK